MLRRCSSHTVGSELAASIRHPAQVHPTPVYYDSDSTTKVSNLEASPRRSLYLMLRSQFITDSFKLGETIVKKIAGTQNPTDDGTKYLPFEQWHRYWQFKLNF